MDLKNEIAQYFDLFLNTKEFETLSLSQKKDLKENYFIILEERIIDVISRALPVSKHTEFLNISNSNDLNSVYNFIRKEVPNYDSIISNEVSLFLNDFRESLVL